MVITSNSQLRKILSYKNPYKEEYELLSRSQEIKGYHPYCENALGLISTFSGKSEVGSGFASAKEKRQFLSYLKGKLKGKPLLDLGCGFWFPMASFARKMGALSYLGVDLMTSEYNDPSMRKRTEEDIYTNQVSPGEGPDMGTRFAEKSRFLGKKIDLAVVYCDMLAFISRFCSQSNVAICGIDVWVIGGTYAAHEFRAYNEALTEEIARVVGIGGIVLGAVSDIYTNFKSDKRFAVRHNNERWADPRLKEIVGSTSNWVFERVR